MKVLFYDPHPGFAGAAAWLPPDVGAVADELEDTVGTVEGAMEMIRKAVDSPNAKVSDHPKQGMICLQIGDFANGILTVGHSWRVIRYRLVEDE